jgi:transcriptional regulator with XRE-family HTH domain
MTDRMHSPIRSVAELVDRTSDSRPLKETFKKIRASRKIVQALSIMRCAAGLSQADIGRSLGVTQSRVSKIEAGNDGSISLAELQGYAKALGRDLAILMPPGQGARAVELVKFHAMAMKSLLEQIAETAQDDEVITQGVAKFWGEAFINLMSILQDTSQKLPVRPDNGGPYVRFEFGVVPEAEQPKPAGTRRKAAPRTRKPKVSSQ